MPVAMCVVVVGRVQSSGDRSMVACSSLSAEKEGRNSCAELLGLLILGVLRLVVRKKRRLETAK